MSEIKVGDKVKLKRELKYKKVIFRNGKQLECTDEIHKSGAIYTVSAVVNELGLVMLDGISMIISMNDVEMIEELYTGKAVCINVRTPYSHTCTIGKVYNIIDGKLTLNSGSYIPGIKSLNDLYTIADFLEVTNPEELKKPAYYNEKVICIDDGGINYLYTVGKIYTFIDGVTMFDDGSKSARILTLDELRKYSVAKFIEIKK